MQEFLKGECLNLILEKYISRKLLLSLSRPNDATGKRTAGSPKYLQIRLTTVRDAISNLTHGCYTNHFLLSKQAQDHRTDMKGQKNSVWFLCDATIIAGGLAVARAGLVAPPCSLLVWCVLLALKTSPTPDIHSYSSDVRV